MTKSRMTNARQDGYGISLVIRDFVIRYSPLLFTPATILYNLTDRSKRLWNER
jgi:hypothetical protein